MKPHLTIGYICTTPFVYEIFVMSMIRLVSYNVSHGIEANYLRANHGSQAHARNELVDNMQGDWLLMLDTDMVFDPGIVKTMLDTAKEHNFEILSGLYYKRLPPYHPLSYIYREGCFYPIDPFQAEEPIIELDATGAGCLLIHRNVFKKINQELKEKPFSIISPLSEDFSFFKRVYNLGIKTYLTKEVQCGHIALCPIERKHYLSYNKSQVSKEEQCAQKIQSS